MLRYAAHDLAQRGRRLVESPACGRITFAPAINPARDIEENGLRASPPAPDPAEQRRDVEQAKPNATEHKERDPHILPEKRQAKIMELPMRDIEEERRVAVNANPR